MNYKKKTAFTCILQNYLQIRIIITNNIHDDKIIVQFDLNRDFSFIRSIDTRCSKYCEILFKNV